MIEPRFTQKQTQRFILAPQVRQYLRLLQLPLNQLQNAIEEELETNPTLEEVPQKNARETPEESSSLSRKEIREAQGLSSELHFEETLHALDQIDEDFSNSTEALEDFSYRETSSLQKNKDYRESLITRKESLFDYVNWQIGFLDLDEREQPIADQIVGNLTPEGYVGSSVEEMAAKCGVSVSDVEAVLKKIQSLDPPGIAARNLQETLLLQLERKGMEGSLGFRIVKDYFPLLERKHWDALARELKVTHEAIKKEMAPIGRLDPKPGNSFYSEEPIAVTPDAGVSLDESENGKLEIEIFDERTPEIRINPYYRRLLKDPHLDPESRDFIKQKIQAGLDFMKALSQRRSTLRRITEEIVQTQAPFFEKGFAQLKPLRLKDIAERLGIHESTVSRAIKGKYLSTPQGTLPYKHFFSSRLETLNGNDESQRSMMAKIRALILAEDPAHPLSDQTTVEKLNQEGIKIARRTVAKYRDLLKILPSHLRQKK